MHTLTPDWQNALNSHLERQESRGASSRSLDGRSRQLRRAGIWFETQGLRSPKAVGRADIEAYRADLVRDGRRCPATCRNHLTALRVFFRDLARRGQVALDPSEGVDLPPPSRALPRTVLGAADIEGLRRIASTSGRNRVRNRAIVEVLYATGVRRTECVRMTVGDVDFQRQAVFVQHGKGRRQRYLPIAPRALRWIAAYLRRERRMARRALTPDAPLFAGRRGQALTAHHLTGLTKAWMLRAGIDRPGACHAFRHSMATHMLDHGADIRFIQAMLGHADISTTMRYTHVSIRGLADVYRRTHPAAMEASDCWS